VTTGEEGSTVMVSARFALDPLLSLTATVKLETPAAEGVPLIVPAEVKEMPAGNAPEVRDQEYPPVPPEAASVCE
jgi:hypothetical protein